MLAMTGYFLLALFLLTIAHEYGHFLLARLTNVKVLRFSFGFGPVLARIQGKRGTEYTWSLIPLGGYVKMLDEADGDVTAAERHLAFNRKSIFVRGAVVFAGPAFSIVFAFILLWLVSVIGRPVIPTIPPVVGEVLADSPAQLAGIVAHDRILSIAHNQVTDWMDVVEFVKSHPNQDVTVQLMRNNKLREKKIHIGKILDNGKMLGYFGVRSKHVEWPADGRVQRENPIRALHVAFNQTVALTGATFALCGRLVSGQLSWQIVSGPVGIAQGARDAGRDGIVYYLSFLALVSISVGVLNLLPIPMLDGGHLLYFLIEIVTRKPLSERSKNISASVGIVMLVMLMVVGLGNDVVRLQHGLGS